MSEHSTFLARRAASLGSPRGKIIILGLVVVLLLILLIRFDSSQGSETTRTWGSEVADLARGKPKSGYNVSGKVSINGNIPMAKGFVVAYLPSMRRAIAFSPLDKAGNYKMTDVPPGPFVLVIRKDLSDEPNALKSAALDSLGVPNGFGDEVRRRSKTGFEVKMNRLGKRQAANSLVKEAPAFLAMKTPTKASLDAVHFAELTPDWEAMPEVRWLIDAAFSKYDNMLKTSRFMPPGGEVEPNDEADDSIPAETPKDREYSFNLTVP